MGLNLLPAVYAKVAHGLGRKTAGAGYYTLPAMPTLTEISVTSGNPAQTWGAWAQFIASASTDLFVMGVNLRSTSTSSYTFGIQLGVGAAGSESPISTFVVEPVFSGFTGQYVWHHLLPFPAPVASGARLSVRLASYPGFSDSVGVVLMLLDQANLVAL